MEVKRKAIIDQLLHDNQGQFWNGAKNHSLKEYDDNIVKQNKEKEIKVEIKRPLFKAKKVTQDEDEQYMSYDDESNVGYSTAATGNKLHYISSDLEPVVSKTSLKKPI